MSIALAGLESISVCTTALFSSMVHVDRQFTSIECLSLSTTVNVIGIEKRVVDSKAFFCVAVSGLFRFLEVARVFTASIFMLAARAAGL